MILVDAGPLVAIVDRSDQHHRACAEALAGIREPLGTVWPALTEAFYLLSGVARGQDAVGELVERGAVRLLPLDERDLPRIRELMRKYDNRPMDLADAAIVRAAEREKVRTIFTVDRADFSVYRLYGRTRMKIIP